GYMSPEQVRGMPLDRRSDVFSVGVVLFEILCGQRLFQAETDFATLEKVRAVDVPRPSSVNPNIPKPLENIIFKALTREPEQRYQSAIELHDELQAFMFAQGLFYSRKDLAAWMRENYAREIEAEKEKAAAQADLRPEQFKPNGRSASAPPGRPPPPPSGGRPPPPPPRGRPAPPAPGKKAPKRKTMVMTTSRNLPPPPGKRARPGGAGGPPPDPPTVPIVSFKPGGAPPKPKAKPVKPTSSYSAAAPSSDFDWDDDELETRLFEEEGEGGPAEDLGKDGLSSVPTKVEVGVKAPVPSVIPAPGVAASTDPGPDKGATMVPGQLIMPQPMPAPMAPPMAASVGMPPSPQPPEGPLAPGFGGMAQPSMPGMMPPAGFPGAPAMAMGGAPGMVPSGGAMAMPPGMGYDFDDRPRKSNVGPIIIIVLALLVLFGAGLGGIYVMLKDSKGGGGSKSEGTPTEPQSAGGGTPAEAGGAGAIQAALTLVVTPSDAKVSVDGVEQGGPSPVVVSVVPGKHLVRITHDAHLDFQTEVDVTAAGLSLPVTMQPKAIKLSFELVPAEAKASILSGGQVVGTGKNGEQLPVVRKPEVAYEVEVSAPGYTSLKQPLAFTGEATQTVAVTLTKSDTGSSTTTTDSGSSSSSSSSRLDGSRPLVGSSSSTSSGSCTSAIASFTRWCIPVE
ncbi:MAG: PEGA domain-containing protein, partial [Myxococcales bacterium]|nr:PEGA domain-containing protein [Myxococcales bacterium]